MRRAIARRRPPGPLAVAACMLVAVGAMAGCSGGGDDDGAGRDDGPATTAVPPRPGATHGADDPLPAVVPTPREMRWIGADVAVPGTVDVVVDDTVDEPTRRLLAEVLSGAGAGDVRMADAADAAGGDGAAGLTVRVGSATHGEATAALEAAGVDVPADLPAEGYALAVGGAGGRGDGPAIAVAAGGPAGAFYAAQTLRQLTSSGAVAGVAVVDRPAMRLRGAIEGFYGSPWTQEERLDQLAFYGRFKLNTYVYAPKDDPWHRDRWREPYPADRLAALRTLVERAQANHVRFTFAVSPGVSICYSDPADTVALAAKLEALYDLGVRAFSVALDDIDISRWNCDRDADAYGPPTGGAVARAQVALLNALQRDVVATHEGTQPLQMVPTEYRRTDDSPYRTALREGLDPAIEVMWTGPLVVPAEITVEQAAAAARVFGRPTFVWDNTPVNDFPPTEGRLILAPYDRRQPGLSAQVAGVVLNPMNQASASKVALLGAADFTWNDTAYDPARAHRAAASLLAGGDGPTVDALLAFFDLENLAPTSGDGVSQPQAPVLAGQLDAFRSAWAAGDRTGAVAGLRPTAERLAGASDLIRAHVVDPAFVADCGPWLDATALWGRALVATLDGLGARAAGDGATAERRFAEAHDLIAAASAVHTIEGETRPQGPVRVADGVLDAFLSEAPGLG